MFGDNKFYIDVDEFRKWRKENKVSTEETLDLIFYSFRIYSGLRPQQMRDDLGRLRRYRNEKTETVKKEKMFEEKKKLAEREARVRQEKKTLDDINRPIPITASAEEALRIRKGEERPHDKTGFDTADVGGQ